MRFSEISEEELIEYGKQGFPGYGKGLFRQAYYQHMSYAIHKVEDEEAKKFLSDWISELFTKDNPAFKAQMFEKNVEEGRLKANPVYQQRHFFYLAHNVARIEDPHIREFITNWLGDVAGSTNSQFRQDKWEKFCANAV